MSNTAGVDPCSDEVGVVNKIVIEDRRLDPKKRIPNRTPATTVVTKPFNAAGELEWPTKNGNDHHRPLGGFSWGELCVATSSYSIIRSIDSRCDQN